MTTKSPAQILFDRIIRTWIAPAARDRVKDPSIGPIPLHMALIIWRTQEGRPEVFLNSETHQFVRSMKIVSSGPFPAGTAIGARHVAGIDKIALRDSVEKFPFVFVVQGVGGQYFVTSRGTERVLQHREFDVLRRQLARDGVRLESAERTISVYFDFVRNLYQNLPRGKKSAETKRSAKLMIEAFSHNVTARVRRHMQLPTVIVHQDRGEFVKLLMEARETFIDGQYFSAIASAVTTADLICIRFAERYGLDRRFRRKLLDMTFGQKIQPLRARGLFTPAQERLLFKMNAIRTRNLHPRRPLTPRTLKRDALAAVVILHEVLEGTFSVFRDYTIEDGKLVPKPLM